MSIWSVTASFHESRHPPIRVNITIKVEADVPKAKMDRLEKAARDKLLEYEKTIVTEATRFNKQIEDLLIEGAKAIYELVEALN